MSNLTSNDNFVKLFITQRHVTCSFALISFVYLIVTRGISVAPVDNAPLETGNEQRVSRQILICKLV